MKFEITREERPRMLLHLPSQLHYVVTRIDERGVSKEVGRLMCFPLASGEIHITHIAASGGSAVDRAFFRQFNTSIGRMLLFHAIRDNGRLGRGIRLGSSIVSALGRRFVDRLVADKIARKRSKFVFYVPPRLVKRIKDLDLSKPIQL